MNDVHRVPGAPSCPNCGAKLDGAGGHSEEPESGNWSLCIYCHTMAVYEQTAFGLTLRKPTAAELAEMMADPNVRAAMTRLAQFNTGPGFRLHL